MTLKIIFVDIFHITQLNKNIRRYHLKEQKTNLYKSKYIHNFISILETSIFVDYFSLQNVISLEHRINNVYRYIIKHRKIEKLCSYLFDIRLKIIRTKMLG